MAELAKIVGITQSAISGMEANKIKPSSATLIKLAQNTDINPTWLLTGEGPMTVVKAKGAATATAGAEATAVVRTVELHEEPIAKQFPPGEPAPEAALEMEVHALAGAGDTRDWLQPEPISSIIVPRDFVKPTVFALLIQGDSMAPTLLDGAIVGVDEAEKDIISGKVYAVRLRDLGVAIKRLFIEYGRVVAKSDNPVYARFEIPRDELEQGAIIGRVVWVVERL